MVRKSCKVLACGQFVTEEISVPREDINGKKDFEVVGVCNGHAEEIKIWLPEGLFLDKRGNFVTNTGTTPCTLEKCASAPL